MWHYHQPQEGQKAKKEYSNAHKQESNTETIETNRIATLSHFFSNFTLLILSIIDAERHKEINHPQDQ